MDPNSIIKLALSLANAITELERHVTADPVDSLRAASVVLMTPAEQRRTPADVTADRALIDYHMRAIFKIDELLHEIQQYDRHVVLMALINKLKSMEVSTDLRNTNKKRMIASVAKPSNTFADQTHTSLEILMPKRRPMVDGGADLAHQGEAVRETISALPFGVLATSPQRATSRSNTPTTVAIPAIGAPNLEKRIDSGVSGVSTPDRIIVINNPDFIIRDFGACSETRYPIFRIELDSIGFSSVEKDVAYRFYTWADRNRALSRPGRPFPWYTTVIEHVRQLEHLPQ
jgi:hypothetical protein